MLFIMKVLEDMSWLLGLWIINTSRVLEYRLTLNICGTVGLGGFIAVKRQRVE